MAAAKSQAWASNAEEPPVAVSDPRSPGQDRSVRWRKEVLHGQELVVLTPHDGCLSPPLHGELCESLEAWGIRMTPDQWTTLIQRAVLGPDVRKYIFYNSRAFGILVAVVVYATLWVNLFSTLETFALAPHWEGSFLATGLALGAALATRLLVHWHQQKLDPNTDLRLAAANEAFLGKGFLVGITDVLEKYQSTPQLWLLRVDAEPCRRFLAETLARLEKSRPAALRQRLGKLCAVIETPLLPSRAEEAEEGDRLEDSPLLRGPESGARAPLARRKRLRLVPDGAPEVVAQELAVVFGSCYVRLLVSGWLPKARARRHAAAGDGPCLCQFIESEVLEKRWLLGLS